jgi:metal-responsive CopG/Arc/MetJ family transcriptional regulator
VLHLHLEKGQCMEVFIAGGKNRELQEILGPTRKIRTVRSRRLISASRV